MAGGRPRLLALELAEDPAAWSALGFEAGADGRCMVGTTALHLRGDGPAGEAGGITGWAVEGLEAVDGLPTVQDAGPAPAGDGAPPPAHANGVVAVDHVVVRTPDLDRTVAALEAAGLPCRGRRDAGELRQAFHLLADALVEVVGRAEPEGDGPASFWGVTLVTNDLDAAARLLGDRLGRVKDAVQPGRRIATVRAQEAGVRTPLALITPRP